MEKAYCKYCGEEITELVYGTGRDKLRYLSSKALHTGSPCKRTDRTERPERKTGTLIYPETPPELKVEKIQKDKKNQDIKPRRLSGSPVFPGIKAGLRLVINALVISCTLIAIASAGYSFLLSGPGQGPAGSEGEKEEDTYISPVLKISGEPLTLEDNAASHDPGWDEMIAFLREDGTDRLPYEEGSFASADFAERLHNNAEKAGLRAAVVVVTFEGKTGGHIINAFETRDKGLVYVDCTGTEGSRGELDSFDKIAYVEAGKEYGLISAYYTDSPAYEYYDKRKNKKIRGFYKGSEVTESSKIYWSIEVPENSKSVGPETETGVKEDDKLGQIKDSFSAISEEMRNIGGLLKELAVESTEI